MADVPRRLPPTQGERVRNVDRGHAALSAQGRTASARPVPQQPTAAQVYSPPTGSVVLGVVGTGAGTSITSTGSGPGSSNASGTSSIAIGDSAGPTADFGVSIGVYARATGQTGVAVGYDAKALAPNTTSVGPYSTANHDNAVALGYGAQCYGVNSIAAGDRSSIAATAGKAVAIGSGASVGENSFEAIAIGNVASAIGNDTICIGTANAEGDNAVALGVNTDAGYPGSVAIGCDHTGIGARANAQDEFVLGSANHHVIVAGALVLADGSGGLWRITVSGGALSAVAYP